MNAATAGHSQGRADVAAGEGCAMDAEGFQPGSRAADGYRPSFRDARSGTGAPMTLPRPARMPTAPGCMPICIIGKATANAGYIPARRQATGRHAARRGSGHHPGHAARALRPMARGIDSRGGEGQANRGLRPAGESGCERPKNSAIGTRPATATHRALRSEGRHVCIPGAAVAAPQPARDLGCRPAQPPSGKSAARYRVFEPDGGTPAPRLVHGAVLRDVVGMSRRQRIAQQAVHQQDHSPRRRALPPLDVEDRERRSAAPGPGRHRIIAGGSESRRSDEVRPDSPRRQ